MRKLGLLLITLFISTLAYSQVSMAKVLKLVEITTATRDGLSIAANEFPVIYNGTTNRFERYNGSTWEEWGGGGAAASDITFVPYSTIASTNVQDAIQEVLDETTSGVAFGDINTSAKIAAIVGDETGTGNLVFGTSPVLVTPNLGTPSAAVLTNATGLPALQVTQHETALTITESQISDLTHTGADNLGVDADRGDFTVATGNATIDTGVVTTGKILDGTIKEEDLDVANAPTDEFVLTYEAVGGVLLWEDRGTSPTSIVGISGTKAEYDTSLTDGDFLYVGDDTLGPDGDKGEVTVGGTGTTLTVNDDVIGKNHIDFNVVPAVGDFLRIASDANNLITASSVSETIAGLAITASDIPIVDTGAIITATEVEGALQEAFSAIIQNTDKETNATHSGDVVGDQALTIQTDAVEESMILNGAVSEAKLNVFNAPTDGYVFGWDSTNGMQWQVESAGGIKLHAYSDVTIDSIYVGTAAQIAARPLGTDVLSFATDETIELTDLTDVNTSTATNKFFLVADGVDFESRAITNADFTVTSELDLAANSIGATAQTATGDGTTTIDWGNGNFFHFQFGAFNETFTFTAPTKPGTFILKLIQDSVGSRTATWPATVEWPGGTAPTLTTTLTTGTDIITFYFDGTDYFAVSSLDFQ